MAKTALETKPETVLVQNVFHLMAYAFRALDVKAYERVGSEAFVGMDDLLAAILLIGVESQRRRGFERDYKPVCEMGWRIKGRVDVRQTMQLTAGGSASAAYEYDEYDEDTQFNRILKTSLLLLLKSTQVSESRRARLRGAIAALQGVETITNPSQIRWSELRYHRNNRSYELLMNVCYLVIQQRLVDPTNADLNLALFDDKQWFSALFENFILNYYQRHYPQLQVVGQDIIRPNDSAPKFVPHMFTDVTITDGTQSLIIDAKCYGRIFTMNYSKAIMSPEHVRQIFYYATHMGSPDCVRAMLMYAGTGERSVCEFWRDNDYELGCMTLDLNRDFAHIAADMDSAVRRVFGDIERVG